MVQEACAAPMIICGFGACSTAYKEASDCHGLAAPMGTSTTSKPRTLILQREIFLYYKFIFLNLPSDVLGNYFN